MSSPSPRNGVEALRMASSFGTSPPPVVSPFGQSLGAAGSSSAAGPSGIALGLAAVAEANGNGATIENGSNGVDPSAAAANGRSLHRKSNSSLSGGESTLGPKKDKGLYPSRVVLTSESQGRRRVCVRSVTDP